MSNHQNQDLGMSTIDLLCFICQDYFCKPYTTSCGHSYCYMCIEEYTLYSDTCPQCETNISQKPITPLLCLSELVQNILKNDESELVRLKKRKQASKEYFNNRELRGIKVGLRVDIRDSNSIWCEGMITRIITRLDEPNRFLRISYLNYMEKKEEDVPINSNRLASKGFFTNRKDIPHYAQKQKIPIISKYQT